MTRCGEGWPLSAETTLDEFKLHLMACRACVEEVETWRAIQQHMRRRRVAPAAGSAHVRRVAPEWRMAASLLESPCYEYPGPHQGWSSRARCRETPPSAGHYATRVQPDGSYLVPTAISSRSARPGQISLNESSTRQPPRNRLPRAAHEKIRTNPCTGTPCIGWGGTPGHGWPAAAFRARRRIWDKTSSRI